MKKILLATTALLAFASAPASAADLAPKMVTKAPQAIWDWTGFYLGGYAGVGVQRSTAESAVQLGNIDLIGSGFTGGATAGYNWQATRNIVLGVEGDIGYLGLSDNVRNFNEGLFYNQKTSWIATLRGRAGWSNGPTLSYVTAGAAWVNAKDTISTTGGAFAESSKTNAGWTWGTGTEVMLGGGWTAKSEYLYVSAGSGDSLTAGGFNYQVDPNRYQMQRFGVNYLFGSKQQPALRPSNWGGFYAGLVGGGAASENRGTSPTGAVVGENNNNASGYNLGGQIGYNWQFAPMWVAGVEGDFSWLGLDRTHIDFNDPGETVGVKTSWVATARARLGYVVGPSLLYVTGGGAWVNLKDSSTGFAPPTVQEASKTVSGYTVGAGIETVLAGNWSSRTEYLYIDAGNGNVVGPTTPLVVDHNFHLFRSALTYKFGG